MRKRVVIPLVIVLLVPTLVLMFRPRQQPNVFGPLPSKDVSEIVRIIRSELRHDLIPGFSFESIRQLPSSIRRHWSDQILSIRAETDGTVEVMTGVIRGPLNGSGNTYRLNRGPNGWEITSKGFWVSSVETTPKVTGANAGGPRQLLMQTRSAARVAQTSL